uniref:Ig-like domain-containing protein n=1 Tax=Amphimedon queenslandica TaxID=400682 RepID=A0A1X7UUM4_AMPQE
MEVQWLSVYLFFAFTPSLIYSQPYSFITDPSDDTQPIYAIAEEGLTVSLYCHVTNEGAGANGQQIQSLWQSKRTIDDSFTQVIFNSSGISIEPDYLVGNIQVFGDSLGIFGTFQVNFTILNFTIDINLISFKCGQPDADTTQFTIGLPVIPSLLINVPVQTVTEGEDISTGSLQQLGSDPFPPTITSSQLLLNINPVSSTGVTVNDYNVSFTNVQRNQSGIYTLTVSNDAGTTAINANGTDVRNINNIVPAEGIPSSPVITGTVPSPGVLVLRVRTMYPGDTNIRFIVNTTNTSDGSIISSTTHQFNGYEANDIVNISISIPNGGLVSISIVTINQYGSSDVLTHPQIFTIDPITPSISTATGSIIDTPTTTPQTVDKSGLSSGAIAGITISIFILLTVVIILIIIIVLQCLCLRQKNKASADEKEPTAFSNISSIPSVSNEAYAAVDSIVNVQENVAYSLPAGHTITAASPPTGSSTAPPAVYETINF